MVVSASTDYIVIAYVLVKSLGLLILLIISLRLVPGLYYTNNTVQYSSMTTHPTCCANDSKVSCIRSSNIVSG